MGCSSLSRTSKKQPFAPIQKLASPNKWWCVYGMHSFEWHKPLSPVDCPDRHAIRTTLVEEMLENRVLREAFREYKTPIDKLDKRQLVELIKLINVPTEIEI